MDSSAFERFIGPAIVCVRGPSRSGKTTLSSDLIAELGRRGHRVAYAKRTHHLLDLPEKSSARVWDAGPAAMALRATDRVQLTLPPGDGSAANLLALLPADADLVLLETHQPEPHPTLLANCQDPEQGERVIARWSIETLPDSLATLAMAVEALMPADRTLDLALRASRSAHGGHLCPGLVLGTRIALAGAAALGFALPDRSKRLTVFIETDRCAADAVSAITGCRVGKRNLRLLDYGKLAATFVDVETGRAVRAWARPGLRERVVPRPGLDRHLAQLLAYLELPGDEVVGLADASLAVDEFDLPGSPKRRVTCGACREEVSDGREVFTELGPRCKPCAKSIVMRETL